MFSFGTSSSFSVYMRFFFFFAGWMDLDFCCTAGREIVGLELLFEMPLVLEALGPLGFAPFL